ncbi:MAG: hypothetical protein H8E94_04170 [Alphaproteobacteria bacterium]|nr:hypothetical protein [Alphaproteobacteria bacterium]
MNDKEKRYLFDNPRNVRLLINALYVVCAVLFGLDFIVHRHIEVSWEGWYGFYAIYGFVGCVALVLLAKEMRKIVMRREDYYDDK